jgi:hypothetical protein
LLDILYQFCSALASLVVSVTLGPVRGMDNRRGVHGHSGPIREPAVRS